MTEGSIHQDNKEILNLYGQNIMISKYIQQTQTELQ